MADINNGLGALDILNIFSIVLQLSGYEYDLKSASNDDIMKELQEQDRKYLKKIIDNQERIIKLLENTND